MRTKSQSIWLPASGAKMWFAVFSGTRAIKFLKEINDTLSEFKGYSLDDTLEIISGNYKNNQ